MQAMPKLVRWTVATLVIHTAVVAATSSALFFSLSGRAAFRVFGGNLRRGDVFDDVSRHYLPYAEKMVRGREVPYRDFVVEYPILALPAFAVPYLVAPDPGRFPVAFAVEMMLCDAVLIALIAATVAGREGPDRVVSRLAWTSLCVLGFGSLMVARYDLYPAALNFGGAMLWSAGRPFAGGAILGLGALVKIFPALVAGPAFVRSFPTRSAVLGALGVASTTVLGLALWASLAGRGLIDSFAYHAERGFEMGSVYSGVFGAIARLSGLELKFEYLHSSMEITTPWAAGLVRFAMPIQAAALLLVLWRARRSGPEEWPRYGAAVLLAFIVTGKVLSPQYLIWPMPFLAVMEGQIGRRARAIFLACCLTTALVFPWAQYGMTRLHPLALVLLNARNGLLVLLLIVLLGPARPIRNPHPASASS
ncbi:MAG: putative rane protein [Planctomycetota bacterium]|nr:putative rane protein [Planctomycetota bacterium]